MKKFLTLILVFAFAGSAAAASLDWWGMVSFRQRHEETTEYTDFTMSGEPGTERYTDSDSRTRLGYRLGFTTELSEYVTAGFTMQSGLNSVLWQDINNSSGMMPGVQHAYLDWATPYVDVQMGRIPQDGTAMWDIYASVNQTDWRLYNPTDGVFSDRMGYLNGVRMTVPVEIMHEEMTEYQGHKLPHPVVIKHLGVIPRVIYHADKVAGYKRDYFDSEQPDERTLDWYTVLVGLEANYSNMLLNYKIDGDYGMPNRLGDKYRQDDKDSVYVDEYIWGINQTLNVPFLFNYTFEMGYGENWRDSIFTARYWDYKMAAEFMGYRLTGRRQIGSHEHEFGNYIGSKAIRSAWHLYLNKTFWDLDFQPRVIWFKTEIDQAGELKDQQRKTRYELTVTAKF